MSSCVIGSYWGYPYKAGVVEIPSNIYSIEFAVRDDSINPFDAFFNGGMTYEKVHRKTNSVSIKIKVSPSIKRRTLTERIAERNDVVFALDISGSMIL